eukprot:12015834-Ditylum_brightwellii.AAC.1
MESLFTSLENIWFIYWEHDLRTTAGKQAPGTTLRGAAILEVGVNWANNRSWSPFHHSTLGSSTNCADLGVGI